jgi:hypothetical protein
MTSAAPSVGGVRVNSIITCFAGFAQGAAVGHVAGETVTSPCNATTTVDAAAATTCTR